MLLLQVYSYLIQHKINLLFVGVQFCISFTSQYVSEDLGTVCNPWFCRRVPVNTGTSGVALIELCWKGEGLTKHHCGPISALHCNSCDFYEYIFNLILTLLTLQANSHQLQQTNVKSRIYC